MERFGPSKSPQPLHLEDFDYALPGELIAQEPARPRDTSRLLVIDRKSGFWTDSRFDAIQMHLQPGDVLVLNDTRVLPARVFGSLARTGRDVELLFVASSSDSTWEAMLRPGRRVREGDVILLSDGTAVTAGPATPNGLRELTVTEGRHASIRAMLSELGSLPLPPYLNRNARPADGTDYQTIFAQNAGAVAAPTAGLHFSETTFRTLAEAGVEVVRLTLHVGIGTFLPVRTDDPRSHVLQPERYALPEESVEVLNRASRDGRRIIAVGTTTTRALEHIVARHGKFVAGAGETGLYILPGHRFQAIDGLLTNFHLPRSTLLMLVAAFTSREIVMAAYGHAVECRYRFYSYGDCCLFI